MRLWLTLIAIVSIGPAQAHDWYPESCCSGIDCAPITDDALAAEPGGWRIKATGELWPYARTRTPPDGQAHWCHRQTEDRQTLCLFVPPRGS